MRTTKLLKVDHGSVTDHLLHYDDLSPILDRNNIMKSRFTHVPECTAPFHSKVLEKLLDHAKAMPDRIALLHAENPSECITYRELHRQAHSLASFLSNRGFAHQDVCCQILPNCIEYVPSYLGVMLAGGASLGANGNCTQEELEYAFNVTKCKVVITNTNLLRKVIAAAKYCPFIEVLICVKLPFAERIPKGLFPWKEVVGSTVSFSADRIHSADDAALIQFTCGVNGPRKAVVMSHKNISTNLDILCSYFSRYLYPKLGHDRKTNEFIPYKENAILTMPFHHMYGFDYLNRALVEGTTGVILRKFHNTVFLNSIQKFRPRILHVVPPLVLFLLANPLVKEYDLSSLEAVVLGTPPFIDGIVSEFLQKFEHVKYLIQAYGWTECGIGFMSSLKRRRGKATILPSFEQKMLSTDSDVAVGLEQVGEICLRTPTLMKGYLNSPEETAKVIDADGWFRTGDLGVLDRNGQTVVVNQKEELIRVGGTLVTSSELEQALMSHRDVVDAGVIGIPDGKLGEKPRAYVVTNNRRLKAEEIAKFISEKVEPHKALTGGVEIVNWIPRTPSGKILRRLLRHRFENHGNNHAAS